MKTQTSQTSSPTNIGACRYQTMAAPIELPKFRYLDDITRHVDRLSKEVDELTKLSGLKSQQLAYLKRPRDTVQSALVKAAGMTFNITQDDKATMRQMKRKIDPTLDKVVIPNLSKLKTNYGLAEEFYEKHRTLEAMETTLAMQFKNRADGPAYNEALSSIRALKSKVDEALKKVLGDLNEVAEGHIPKTFKTYMGAINQEVQNHVNFEDSNLFLYVHVDDEGNIVFTYYLMLNHAINDEGKITPHLYISIQWIVGETVKIRVDHEYELPNKLLKEPGTTVTSAGEAVKAISHLLDVEDFSTSLGTLPFGHHLAQEPKPGLFSYKDYTSKITVDNENLVFKLKKGTDGDTRRQMAYQLYQEVKNMLKVPKGAKLKMEIKPSEIVFNIASVAAPGQINTYQAEWIKDQFGLSDQAVRKIVNIINQEAH